MSDRFVATTAGATQASIENSPVAWMSVLSLELA